MRGCEWTSSTLKHAKGYWVVENVPQNVFWLLGQQKCLHCHTEEECGKFKGAIEVILYTQHCLVCKVEVWQMCWGPYSRGFCRHIAAYGSVISGQNNWLKQWRGRYQMETGFAAGGMTSRRERREHWDLNGQGVTGHTTTDAAKKNKTGSKLTKKYIRL